jgi:ABC-2 type transport system permease protein
MLDALGLYLRYVAVNLRAKLQYRASVFMQIAGMLLVTAVEFVGVWALFDRFGSFGGWTLPEVALLYGLVEVTFALSDLGARGFDTFPSLVASGEFDRLLVRPRSTVLQLAGQDLAPKSLGRAIQAIAVLVWAAAALQISWSIGRVALLVAALTGGVCLFWGLLIAQAALAFWTVEPLELMNALTYGGVETAHYPMTVYRPWFRRFFTFVVPLACVTYLPGLAIMGRADPLGTSLVAQALAPLGGVAFLAAALQLWRAGVRRYMSAGG